MHSVDPTTEWRRAVRPERPACPARLPAPPHLDGPGAADTRPDGV